LIYENNKIYQNLKDHFLLNKCRKTTNETDI